MCFARDWGLGGVTMVNLFSFRATDPRSMMAQTDPVGPDSDMHLLTHLRHVKLVVCAWGADGGFKDRDREVLDLIRANSSLPPMCLGVTLGGFPRHPLYLAKSTDSSPIMAAEAPKSCPWFPAETCDAACAQVGCGLQGLLILMRADGVPEAELEPFPSCPHQSNPDISSKMKPSFSPDQPTPNALADFDQLSRDEQRAWLGWFAGGSNIVTKYGGREHVHFGKYECEQVDFQTIWLGKFVDLGWLTFRERRRFKALGMVGHPESIEYELNGTDEGFAVREAFWDRLNARSIASDSD